MADQNQKCDSTRREYNPSWTHFERQLKSFQSSQCENVNLNEAINRRMQASSLGSFLYHLNSGQTQETFIQQDKLERMQFDIEKGLIDVSKLGRVDDICEDMFRLIELCINNSPMGKMTVKNVLNSMNFLRLTGSKVTNIDNTLRRLRDLQGLVLGGNCISSCPGGSLPRSLMVLELCYNRLDDISCLAAQPPLHLLYLGLARNNLTSGVAGSLSSFQFLYHLDLAQNNIEDLSEVVAACSRLRHLSSLLLIGNPCSMSPNYTTFILRKMPKLIFLDGEMLKEQENYEDMELEQCLSGTLQIYLFRVMGLPQPSNEKINKKKVTHSFRLEVEPSLLQPYLLEKDKSFIIDEKIVQNEEEIKKSEKKDGKKKKNSANVSGKEETKKSEDKGKKKKSSGNVIDKEKKKSQSNVTDKEKKKSSGDVNDKERKKSSSDFKGKKGKKLLKDEQNKENPEEGNSVEKREAEKYKLELKLDQATEDCFKSGRKNWGKIIEFDDPAIEVSDCDLWALRDIFRTDLTLRIVHLKTLPPATKGKSKPKKQKKSDPLDKNNPGEGDENKEILVSKSTVAKIKLPLQDIIWNKKYLEYTWNITKPYFVEPTTDLKTLQYVVKKKKEPKSKKGEVKPTGELPIPSVLTCHVGVGVKREEPTEQVIKID